MSSIEKLSPERQATIETLIRCNVPVTRIAKETGISVSQITQLMRASEHVTIDTRLNAKDSELADGLRALAWKALMVADETLEVGSPYDQQLLARGIISRSMALIGAEKTSSLDSLRESFNELIGSTQSPDQFDYDLEIPEDADEVYDT